MMRWLGYFIACAAVQQICADLLLTSGTALTWNIASVGNNSYALGQPLYSGAPIDTAVDDAIAYWRRVSDEFVVPVLATQLVQLSASSAQLSGTVVLPNAGNASVTLQVSLRSDAPAADLSVSFSASSTTPGWQLCVKWMHDGPSNDSWALSGYPNAGNTTSFASTSTLDYMGWPGFWIYRPNASTVAFFSLSIADDFSNPTSWTGATTFGFVSSGGYQVAPQFMFGGAGMDANEVYTAGMQLFVTQPPDGDMLTAVRTIVPALLSASAYAVQPMPDIRSHNDSLACFLNARATTPMWRSTPNGSAYQLQDIASFIYLGTTPESAYFEYEMWRITNDSLWRTRAMAQMAFWLQGQNLNTSSRHYGAVDTTYTLPDGPYNSDDRGGNVGWKIDLNAHMARYTLLLWEAVWMTEGANMTAWWTAAQLQATWLYAIAADQVVVYGTAGGAPGSAGLPQRIVPGVDTPTPSVASGRTMNALPVLQRILGDTPACNLTLLRTSVEAWMVANIEGLLFFSGQHPDLPWWDYEQDSVWELVEYWLTTASEPGARPDALQRAIGDAYVALMMLCPKQLSWVGNPTQMAASEQQEYAQYCVYTYHNRKYLALTQLAAATNDSLWGDLAARLFQLNMFTQVVQGAADDLGGFHEAICDPWLARGGGYNFVGSVYLNELALDMMVQLHALQTMPTPGYSSCNASSFQVEA